MFLLSRTAHSGAHGSHTGTFDQRFGHEIDPKYRRCERRQLYREDVAGVIEQYQAGSRKYRRVHNTFQSLIMIGSALTTAIAAMDTGKQLT